MLDKILFINPIIARKDKWLLLRDQKWEFGFGCNFRIGFMDGDFKAYPRELIPRSDWNWIGTINSCCYYTHEEYGSVIEVELY